MIILHYSEPGYIRGDNFMFEDLGLDVVTVHMGDNKEYIKELNEDLKNYRNKRLFITGNEDSTDLYKQIDHPNIWLQTPKVSDEAQGYIPFGYPTKIYSKESPKINQWFFSGQITHERRRQCAEVLRTLPDGRLIETEGYGQGLNYPEYIQAMTQAQFVPCPSGPTTPDTFRVYEALECDAIPILDNYSSIDKTNGFWDKVLGNHPMPTINEWADLKFPDYNSLLPVVKQWWAEYKANL